MTDIPWLRYSNQGATRNDPLDPRLIETMSFLPELGVTMEVFSGGQEAAGEGGSRTGSTRHDHGGAGDVFFYKDGRRLDWANPDDQPLFAEIVKRGRQRGLTGIGAGDGYMQPGSMHIGFGSESVWGAGGKGSNAPEWLRSAFWGTKPGPGHSTEDGHGHAGSKAYTAATSPGTDYAGGATGGTYSPGTQKPRDVMRLKDAYEQGLMTPEDEAIYERGMKAGKFPEAKRGPSALEIYAATALQRPQWEYQLAGMPPNWQGM